RPLVAQSGVPPAPARVRPAPVGPLARGPQGQQGALAGPVAPDDASALAGRHPSRYAVQEQPLPVSLDHLLQVDQVHACSVGVATMAAPGAGPVTCATVRQTSAPASAAARSRAWRRFLARKAQVGPEPETMAPRAPNSLPAASVRRSPGRSEIAAGCRSLASSGPSFAGSPERS